MIIFDSLICVYVAQQPIIHGTNGMRETNDANKNLNKAIAFKNKRI